MMYSLASYVVAIVVCIIATTVSNINAFTIPKNHHQGNKVTITTTSTTQTQTQTQLYGYLDDLKKYTTDPEIEKEVDDSREATNMAADQIDRYGPGDLRQFVDFNEFDGGDGQMGVAGDGSQGLDKEWTGQAQMGKSKTMSAKVAWGKSTGYADTLREQGVDTARAQQLENWNNQREVQEQRNQHKWMTDSFDQSSTSTSTNKGGPDQDWRSLSSYSGELTQDTDIDQSLGQVIPGPVTSIIELHARANQASVHEFSLKNPFMGFSDFRARFTQMSNPTEWNIDPAVGSLNGRGDPTTFTLKFRPQSPGVSQGYLVVETEDDKWTYQLLGHGSM